MKFAVIDIEATALKSDQGFLLCCGIKPLGEKPRILGLHEFKRQRNRLEIDSALVVAVRDELEKYDGFITWNGIMYDIPFLNDRLMLNGHDPIEKRFQLDMMWHARQGKSALTSSRLDWVAKAFRVKASKTSLELNTWKMAEAEAISGFIGGRKAYDYILAHNLADLEVTEQVYEKLKPRVQSITKR